MTDHDALLAAVLALPEDDLPRLVLADWLEETGHPANAARAAFVRAQVAAERLPPGSAERAALEERSGELFRAYGAGWNRQLPEWVSWQDTEVGYRRGFVEELSTTPLRLFRDGGGLFAVAPVRTVRLRAQTIRSSAKTRIDSRTVRMFRDQDYFARIAHLRLGPRLLGAVLGIPKTPLTRDAGVPYDITLLTKSRKLTGLRALDVSGNDLSDDWVLAFARRFRRASFARTLTVLDLSDNQVTDAGAAALAAAGLDGARLILRRNRITPEGADQLRRRLGELVEV
jgi:uncharacterized protein (TIGR02996 family)